MRFVLRFFGFLFSVGAIFFLIGAVGLAYGYWIYLEGPAGPRPARRLRAAGDDPRPRLGRQPDRRICPRAAALRADPGRAEARDRGVPVGRGQEFLQACGHRSRGPRARRRGQSALRRQARAGRLDDHPAGRQELPAVGNERSYERKIREALLALRIESTFSKDRILELYLNEIYPRHPDARPQPYGVAAAALELFRQVGPRADHRRGRLSRGPAEGARTTTIPSASARPPSSAATG